MYLQKNSSFSRVVISSQGKTYFAHIVHKSTFYRLDLFNNSSLFIPKKVFEPSSQSNFQQNASIILCALLAGYVKVDRSFDNCQCPCPCIWSLRGGVIWQFCFWLPWYRNAICNAESSNRIVKDVHEREIAFQIDPLAVKWHHFLLPASMLFSLKWRHHLADLLLIVLIQKFNIWCIQLKQKWKLLSRLIFSFSRRFESVWNEICFPDWSSLLSSDIIFSGAHLVLSLHSSFLGRKISCLPISFYLSGTRTIYFTTFSNVSYKLPPDPWQAIGKVIRMQIFFSKYFFFDQR